MTTGRTAAKVAAKVAARKAARMAARTAARMDTRRAARRQRGWQPQDVVVEDELARKRGGMPHPCESKLKPSFYLGVDEQGVKAARPIRACRLAEKSQAWQKAARAHEGTGGAGREPRAG